MSTLLSRSVRSADRPQLHLEGSGRPRALMIHGLGYASWEAHAVRDRLGADFGLWSLDNRGTGRSEANDGGISIEELAEDAALAVDDLGGPLWIIGHSMGGYIAQQLAIRHPQKVRGLVLIATGPGGARSEPVPSTTINAWAKSAGLSPAEYARQTMPLSFRAGWTDQHPAEFEHLLRARLEFPTGQETWRHQFEACERYLAAGIDLDNILASTLVIHGTGDRVVPVANGRLLADQLPRSEYHEVAGAGHLIHLEEPELVASLIKTFTADNIN